jgi:NTP pyrophosphatase (non-canonical NTP hydrolase)
MEWKEYTILALRTEAPSPTGLVHYYGIDMSRAFHGAIGLCTEAGELLKHDSKKNLGEELGDLCWYIALLESSLEIDLSDVLNHLINDANTTIMVNATLVLDQFKKCLFYNKPVDKETLVELLTEIVSAIDSLAFENGYTIDEILFANIEKLKARYPHKYTDEAATFRDLDKENEALDILNRDQI